MPFVYSIVSVIAFVLLWPLLWFHPKLRSGWTRRNGIYDRDFLSGRTGPRIWLHGASAGDLLGLLPIAREIRARRPDAVLVVSTMTNSGEAIAKTRFADADAITFLPYDVPWAVRGAIKAVRPDVLVLEYTELWPALIRAAKAGGTRVVLTNGRLSEGKVGRYRWMFRLIGNVLREFDLLLMRDAAERDRALMLDAEPSRVLVTGNTKFDALLTSGSTVDPSVLAKAMAIRSGDLVWVAGSTHEGEEPILLDALIRLRTTIPSLRLVIAPRYLERVPKIVALVQARGLSVGLRSSPPAQPADVVVLDTIGELNAAYALGSIVFVGGSFVRRGGQNILEPAACGRTVLFGPHMENFRDSVQVLVGRGGIPVRDGDQLEVVMRELLAKPEKLVELGALAKAAVSGVRGASARDADEIVRLVARSEARS